MERQGIRWTTVALTALTTLPADPGQGTFTPGTGDTFGGQALEHEEHGVLLTHPTGEDLALPAEVVDVPEGDPIAAPPPADASPEPGQDAEPQQAVAGEAVPERTRRLTLGFDGTGGNTSTMSWHSRLYSVSETEYARWIADTSWFYGKDRGKTIRHQFDAQLTRDWLQAQKAWFFFLRSEFKHDRFRSWENRASLFGGAGWTLVECDDLELRNRFGFGGTLELGEVNEFFPEAMFGGSALKWKINERTLLSCGAVWYPSLEDVSEYRLQSDVEWIYRLDNALGMSLKVGAWNEYDSVTPEDEDGNDLKYFMAFEVGF